MGIAIIASNISYIKVTANILIGFKWSSPILPCWLITVLEIEAVSAPSLSICPIGQGHQCWSFLTKVFSLRFYCWQFICLFLILTKTFYNVWTEFDLTPKNWNTVQKNSHFGIPFSQIDNIPCNLSQHLKHPIKSKHWL